MLTAVLVAIVAFAAGVLVATMWPKKVVTADYATMRSETARLEKIFTAGITGLHLKVDEVLASAKSKL